LVYTNLTGWRYLDDYYLENPGATDGLPFAYSVNNGVVDIPIHTVETAYLGNSYFLGIQLLVTPMTDVLDWAQEVGPQYTTQAAWIAGDPLASPVIAPMPQVPCLPDFRTDLCGPGAYVPATTPTYSWNDYYSSNYYTKIASQYGSGIVSGLTLNIYRKK